MILTSLTLDEIADALAPRLASMLSPVDLDKPLTRAELARHYGCSPATVNRKQRAGIIPAKVRAGRYVTTMRMIVEEAR